MRARHTRRPCPPLGYGDCWPHPAWTNHSTAGPETADCCGRGSPRRRLPYGHAQALHLPTLEISDGQALHLPRADVRCYSRRWRWRGWRPREVGGSMAPVGGRSGERAGSEAGQAWETTAGASADAAAGVRAGVASAAAREAAVAAVASQRRAGPSPRLRQSRGRPGCAANLRAVRRRRHRSRCPRRR